jgi:hypothetical protein
VAQGEHFQCLLRILPGRLDWGASSEENGGNLKVHLNVEAWMVPSLAVAAICAAVILMLSLNTDVAASSAIIQAGATVALAFLTYGYLRATSVQARAASEAANESARIRRSAIVPCVVLRYRQRLD